MFLECAFCRYTLRMQVRVSARDKSWWGCEIILFAVDKEYQKQGIGKRQLAEIEDKCKELGIPQLVVLSAEPAEPRTENWWLYVSPTAGGTAMQGPPGPSTTWLPRASPRNLSCCRGS